MTEALRGDLCEADEAGVHAGGPLDPVALAAANINPASGLATDYLNHFNEITMLIGLVADMPEVMDDIALWHPLGYERHFERSGFAGKTLAIAAYRALDPSRRQAFEAAIAMLDREILAALAHLRAAEPCHYRALAEDADRHVSPLVSLVSGLIHDGAEAAGPLDADATQDGIDLFFALSGAG